MKDERDVDCRMQQTTQLGKNEGQNRHQWAHKARETWEGVHMYCEKNRKIGNKIEK
jgi:hypothetical protein